MPRGVAKHVFALSSRVFCVAIDCTVSTQHRAPHRAAPTRDSETRHDTRHDTACQLRTSRHVYSSVTSVTTWCAACPEDRTHALGFGWYAASRETAASAVLGGGAKDLVRFTMTLDCYVTKERRVWAPSFGTEFWHDDFSFINLASCEPPSPSASLARARCPRLPVSLGVLSRSRSPADATQKRASLPGALSSRSSDHNHARSSGRGLALLRALLRTCLGRRG